MPMDTPAFEGYQPSSNQSMGLSDILFGGLRYLGETLSKPAAALRGLLAGQPGQLANLIPFSDAMGITDPSQRVSGRDLLRSFGMADQQDTTGNFLGGMLAEAVTDPTLLASALPGGMAKMTSLMGKVGVPSTLGETASTVASKAASMVPQGVQSMASKAATGMDDLVERLSGSRLLTTGTPLNNPTSSVATRGAFGSERLTSPLGRLNRQHKELTDWLPLLEGTPKAEVAADAAGLAGQISSMSQGRLPFGMAPRPGTAPLFGGSFPGAGLVGQIPSGVAIPALSLGASAYDMSQEPSPEQMQMLMQRMSRS